MTLLFGRTKVDKLKFVYEKKNINIDSRYKIDEQFQYYFPEFTCFNKMGKVMNRFTPTRLVGDRGNNKGHNLQMPNIESLGKVLNNITLNDRYIQKTTTDTEIHLTKDIILEKKVSNYIEMLSTLPINPKLEVEVYENDMQEKYAMYVRYNHNEDADGDILFEICFYDKGLQELINNETYIYQFYEPISPEDRKLLGSAYNPTNNSLNLLNVNWLRTEITLRRSGKILPLTEILSNYEDRILTAECLIKSIKAGIFYDAIEIIFQSILKKIIFVERKSIEELTKGHCGIRNLSAFLLSQSDNFHTYKSIATEMGLSRNFAEISKIARKIKPESILYQELYDKLLSCPEEQNNYLIKSVQRYNSRSIDKLNLTYSVPILDDS